jgi:glycosyltransferase involved in cell wall biosynthesis
LEHSGVASVLAKFTERLFNVRSLVVHRKAFDPYGVTTYGELWDCSAERFVLRCLLLAKKFDILHIHSLDKLVPILKLLYPKKPIVLHYHGSEIRKKWSLRVKYWSKADAILYSTPDLLEQDTPKRANYLPNPVDTDLFYEQPNVYRKPKTAIVFQYLVEKDKVEKYAQALGVSLVFLERRIPHSMMPETLNRYEYYVDRTQIPSLSKTALEALACGLKVVRWDGVVLQGLPEEHKPENVVRTLVSVYDSILMPW